MLTKEVLDEIITRRNLEGQTLSIEKIDNERYSRYYIHDRSKKYYGGWTNALIANNSRPVTLSTITKQDVTNELKRLQREGHSMKSEDFESRLYQGISKHFGGYKNAKKELDISPKIIRSQARVDADNRKIKWTEKKIKETLLSEVSKGLSRKEIYENNIDMISAIYKRHGNLETFANSHNIELPERYETRWNKESVAIEIKKLNEDKVTLTSSHLRRNGYGSLVHGANVVFGSWNNALEYCGIEPKHATPKDWSKDELKFTVLSLLSEGVECTGSALSKYGLCAAIYKFYGGISGLKEGIGVCHIRYDKPKELKARSYAPNLQTKEGIKREIVRFYYIGAPLNYSYIRKRRSHLLSNSIEIFGSWRSAVEYSGFNYSEISLNTNIRSECGYEFENILGDILRELGVDFEKYAHETLEPDFVVNGGEWIDAKLSETTDNTETIKRYLPHCRSLTIVYLIGSKHTRLRGKKYKYKHASVYTLTDKLPTRLRNYYNARLQEIERKVSANEIGNHSA